MISVHIRAVRSGPFLSVDIFYSSHPEWVTVALVGLILTYLGPVCKTKKRFPYTVPHTIQHISKIDVYISVKFHIKALPEICVACGCEERAVKQMH